MMLAQNTEFGYSRKDIILLGAGLIAFGYALYYGLQVGQTTVSARIARSLDSKGPCMLRGC